MGGGVYILHIISYIVHVLCIYRRKIIHVASYFRLPETINVKKCYITLFLSGWYSIGRCEMVSWWVVIIWPNLRRVWVRGGDVTSFLRYSKQYEVFLRLK